MQPSSPSMDPGTRRHIRFRLLQLLMLALMGLCFFLAAIALPIFDSPALGWFFLLLLLAAVYGFWWAGRQADRRSHFGDHSRGRRR